MAIISKFYKEVTYRRRSYSAYSLLALIFFIALFVGLNTPDEIPLSFFQSTVDDGGKDHKDHNTPLPPSWTFSAGGGIQEFGAVKVTFPPGFTSQGGANIFGDVLTTSPLEVKNQKLIVGTQIALGIWPPNDQTEFQQPIQIQIDLDAAQIRDKSGDQLVIKMYNPGSERWEEVPSEYNKDTFQITTFIQSFKPVPKDFPTWGGRTFLGVFERDLPLLPVLAGTPVPQPKVSITVTNAGQVAEFARWGKGTARKLATFTDASGSWLAVATTEGVYIYERSGEDLVQTGVFSTEAPVDDISFARNKGLLAAGAGEKVYARLINHNVVNVLETGDRVTSLALSPDATMIAVGTQDKLHLWELNGQTWSNLDSLTGLSGQVQSVAFSPDGQRLIISAEEGRTQIRTISDLKQIGTLADTGVKSIVFSPLDPDVLVTASNEQIRLWRLNDRKLLQTLKVHTDTVNSLAFSPDGTLLASASSDQTIRVWSVGQCTSQQTQCELSSFMGKQTNAVESVVFLEDGQTLLSVSGQDKVQLWNVNDDQKSKSILSDHVGPISSLALSPDGQKLLLGSLDQTIHLWQMNDGREIQVLTAPASVKSISFTPSGAAIMAGGNWLGIAMWQVNIDKPASKLGTIKGTVHNLVFSPDGTVLISSTEEGAVHLWQMSNESPVYMHSLIDQKQIESIALSPLDGATLGVGTEDGTIYVLEAASGVSLLPPIKDHMGAVKSLAFSPDGSIIASGGDDGTVRLWQVEDGKLLHSLKGHTEAITSLAFSPDGQILASGSTDDTTQLWMVVNGTSLQVLKGHKTNLNSLIFSKDGLFLITGSEDGIVRLWGVTDQ